MAESSIRGWKRGDAAGVWWNRYGIIASSAIILYPPKIEQSPHRKVNLASLPPMAIAYQTRAELTQ